MKRFLTIFLLSIAVLYSIAWFVIAHVIQDQISDYTTFLKKTNKVKDLSGNVDVSGFPFKFKINIESPTASVVTTDHDGVYTALYDGTISLQVGLFSKTVKLVTNGDLHFKGRVNSSKFHISATGNNTYYTLKLQYMPISFAMFKFVTNPQNSILDIVDRVQLGGKDLQTVNKINGKDLYKIDSFDIELELNNQKKFIRYIQNIENARFENAAIAQWREFRAIPALEKIISKIPYNVRQFFEVFSLPMLKDLSYAIDVSVTTAKDYTDLKIDKFKIRDAVQTIDLSGKVYLDTNTARTDINTEIAVTEKWYELMRSYAATLDVSELRVNLFKQTSDASILKPIAGAINSFINRTLTSADARRAYVPRLHEMGDVKANINTEFKRTSKDAFTMDINKASLETQQFQIKTTGNIKNTNGKEEYSTKTDIKDYAELVSTTSEYINRVLHSAHQGLFSSTVDISQNMQGTIAHFMKKISDNPNASSSNIKITLKKDANTDYPSAGSYSSGEFRMIWAQFVSELLFGKLKQQLQEKLQDKLTNKLGPELGQHVGDFLKQIPGLS